MSSSGDEHKDYEGFAVLQHDTVCYIQDEAAIPKGWILLDNQSTVDMFSNEKLMTIISDAKRSLVLFWNAGKAIVTKKVDLKRYGTVWFHAEGIANILCLMCRKVTK